VKHPDTKVPEEELAIISNAAKAVIPFVTVPWIKGDRRDPGIMSRTSGDNPSLGQRPYRDEIVLAACEHILAVR